MNETRHVLCVHIPTRAFECLAREGVTTQCIQGVPADAKIVGVYFDFQADGFVLTFEHPSFPTFEVDNWPLSQARPPIRRVVLEVVGSQQR